VVWVDCVSVCQLLRQFSAECHGRYHRHTLLEPQTVDDHYVTVNDPTTVHSLLRKVSSVLSSFIRSSIGENAS